MRKAFAFASLMLGACSTTPTEAPEPPMAGICHDDGLATFIGQDATPEVGGELMRQSGARVLRWVPKDSAVTMDFSADRLTVSLDANNKIERLNCG